MRNRSYPHVVGYGRLTPDSPSGQADELRQRLEAYARRYLASLLWGGMYLDGPLEHARCFQLRPGGLKLLASLEGGGHVILASLATSFADWGDFLDTLRCWETQGIVPHLLDPMLISSSPQGEVTLAWLKHFAQADIQRQAEGQRAAAQRNREVMDRRKARGLPVGGPAPYGFKYTGPRGQRRLVADPTTRAIGSRIVQLHDEQGLSLDDIYFLFLRERVKTRKGGEWSKGAIQRACEVERQLQAQESQDRATVQPDAALGPVVAFQQALAVPTPEATGAQIAQIVEQEPTGEETALPLVG